MIPLARLVPLAADLTVASPNHDARPAPGTVIECVVLHATADRGSELSAESWMCNPAAGVSAHLHFRRNGMIVRLVPDSRRAWHAGSSRWKNLASMNDFSLGWEIANRNDCREPYTDAQYQALARAAAHYVRQGLPREAFVSHASVARPRGRKSDPCGFDWERLLRESAVCQDGGASVCPAPRVRL